MKFKKLVVLALSAIMVFAMSTTAFAATKDEVISALNGKVDATYINQAKAFLANVEMTSDQADQVIAKINEAAKVADGVTALDKLSVDKKHQIVDILSEAGATVNVKVSADYSANEVTFTAPNNAKTVIGEVVKDTGVSTYATVTVIAALAIAVVACGVVVSKKKTA